MLSANFCDFSTSRRTFAIGASDSASPEVGEEGTKSLGLMSESTIFLGRKAFRRNADDFLPGDAEIGVGTEGTAGDATRCTFIGVEIARIGDIG